MIDRYQNIARAFLAVLWLAMGGAAAQAENLRSTSLRIQRRQVPRHKPPPLNRLVNQPLRRSTLLKSPDERTKRWGSTLRRRSPVGNASLIAWKVIFAAQVCVMWS